jgi:hypothetical protein
VGVKALQDGAKSRLKTKLNSLRHEKGVKKPNRGRSGTSSGEIVD